jgi:hypothetical protein
MTVVPIRQILGSDIARWIQKTAEERLTKRAQACAINAINYLVRAEKIAEISTNVSFFCATHATEEAVASFVSACKAAGYDDAKQINLHDHKHKAAVSTFAQLISGHAHEVELHIAHTPDQNILVARVPTDAGVQYGPLGMYLFSFNDDPENLSDTNAFLSLSNLFDNPEQMHSHIRERSGFRDHALYATDEGVNQLAERSLALLLQDHAFLTLGLVWAAIDVGQHERREPFLLQVLGAINRVTSGFKSKAASAS